MGRINSNVGLVTGINITDTVDQLVKLAAKPRDMVQARTDQYTFFAVYRQSVWTDTIVPQIGMSDMRMSRLRRPVWESATMYQGSGSNRSSQRMATT